MSFARSSTGFKEPILNLHRAVFYGDFAMVRAALEQEDNHVDKIHALTGMTALQIAIATDHLIIAQYLVQKKASFTPDPHGRMPSIIAIECQVSAAMLDWVVDAEGAAPSPRLDKSNAPDTAT